MRLIVPYSAGGVAGGCLHISENSFSPVWRGERGCVIGVTGATRRPNLPNMPAMGEVVPGYDLSTWMMIFSPPGTPMAIRQRLAQAFAAAMADTTVRERIEQSGNDTAGAGPEAADALWQSEREKLTGLMRRAGLVQG